MDATALLADVRIMPLVVIHDSATAVPLARCLADVGISAIEVTLRTESALRSLELIASAVPEILLGAGSIRRPEHFRAILDAGAAFAVSPGSTETLLEAANLPYLPGAATASEVIGLLEKGYRLQKFFPAESLGGVKTLQAIAAPLPEARFCPTGGINSTNVGAYLALDCVSCVGGSWFIPGDLLADGRYSEIQAAAGEALAVLKDSG